MSLPSYQCCNQYYCTDDIAPLASSTAERNTLGIDGDTIRLIKPRTPASASDTGYVGEACWDSSYVYICIATNTWRRIGHASW